MVNAAVVKWLMAIPVIGWIYILVGILKPFEIKFFKWWWWIAAFLCIVVHALQIPIAMSAGRNLGLTPLRIAAKTMIYGSAWWKPLKMGLIHH